MILQLLTSHGFFPFSRNEIIRADHYDCGHHIVIPISQKCSTGMLWQDLSDIYFTISLFGRLVHVESGQFRPSYDQGRYCVVPSKAPGIVITSVRQIRLPHHTIGRYHPRRFPPNAASVETLGDDHCGSEPCQCIQLWQKSFRSVHQGRLHRLQPLVLDVWGRQERRM